MSAHKNGVTRSESARSERPAEYILRLYVSGASPKSVEAIKNLKSICDDNLAGRHALEVVDIYQQPDRAARDQIVAAPMLVKHQPLPLKRLIGTLSNTPQVLRALGLIRANIDGSDDPHRG
jgi:circadian clock protein KaiB